MESRKIILMNLFAGKEWSKDVEERLVDTVGEGGWNELRKQH